MSLTCHTAKSQCLTQKEPAKYTNKLIKKTTDKKTTLSVSSQQPNCNCKLQVIIAAPAIRTTVGICL